MVKVSKLKAALLAEKPVDFKKQHQKKVAKLARKEKINKVTTKNGTKGGEVEVESEGEWESEDDEEEDLEGIAELEEMERAERAANGEVSSSEDEEEDEEARNMHEALADIDNSDSDSESEAEEQNEVDSEEEDIPLSDLEDLPDEEREDLIPRQRLTINNTTALSTALKRIALPLSTWSFTEHQSLTTAVPVSIADVSDDLTRELAFYAQSLEAVKLGRKKLLEEGAPFSRPKDYFAEMVKADEHMAKVKGKLIEAAAGKKAAAEARKQRDLKKFGKQVQVAKLQEREKEKRQTLENIKTLKRKRQGADDIATNEPDLFDVAVTEDPNPAKKNRSETRGKSGDNKRAKKDAKFGHGGKKRFAKSGTAESSGDLSGFSVKGMKARNASGGNKKPQRAGKGRRAAGKR